MKNVPCTSSFILIYSFKMESSKMTKKNKKKHYLSKQEFIFNFISLIIIIIITLYFGIRSFYYYGQQNNSKNNSKLILSDIILNNNKLVKDGDGLHRNNNGYYFGFLQSAARGKGPVRDPQGVPGTGIGPPKAGAREFVLVNNDESRPCETAFGSIAPSLGCGIAPVQG